MIWDDSCTIFDPEDYDGGTDTFGNPTNTEHSNTVYEGHCRMSGDRYRAVRASGSEAASGFAYLPGRVDVEPDHMLESDDRKGRVLGVERRHRYTRLIMQWL